MVRVCQLLRGQVRSRSRSHRRRCAQRQGFKLIAQEGYAGKLFGTIEVGMNVGEAMSLEPRLFYDEVEEGLYVRGCAGVTLDVPEIDPPPEEVPSYPISAISVYAKEAVSPEGQRGNW